jgi:hypothetical protein
MKRSATSPLPNSMEQSPPEGSTVTTLVMGLYTEGTTDERFLALIAERTAQALLLQAGDVTVDWL